LEGGTRQQRTRVVGNAGQDALPLEQDIARDRGVEAAEAVEQRGLAGAVRADQAGDPSGLGFEIRAVEGQEATEADADVLNSQYRQVP